MSGDKIINGLNEALSGSVGRETVIHVDQTPEAIIASVLADGRTAGSDGIPRVGRATRKKAHEVTKALRDAGWRILR